MKNTLISAIVAQAAAVLAARPGGGGGGPGAFGGGPGMWGGNYFGGPSCASSCFSSYWQTATPTPAAYCGSEASSIGSCVSAACTVDPAAFSTFTSVSASLCSQWASCTSTGTYTYSYSKPTDWPTNGPGGPWGTKTWPTGAVTVTGCPWNGGDVGWGIWGPGGPGGPGGPWGDFGPGWKYTTYTTSYTAIVATATGGTGSNGLPTATAQFTTIGVATIAQAESGASTTRTTLGTAGGVLQTSPPNAAPTGGLAGVKAMGAALGVVVVAAGLM